MNSFEKPRTLSGTVDEEVAKISFGKDYRIVRVDTTEQYLAADAALGMDYRAKDKGGEKFASVYEGLDFDENRIRTQSYCLENGENIVAVFSFAIMPKKWISEERYFRKTAHGVEVCDFSAIVRDDPDFIVAPAWTKVDPAHLTEFAVSGFRLFKNVLQVIEKNSPEHTWTEVVAQGTYERKGDLLKLAEEKGLGTLISEDELPFRSKDIGIPTKGAESTAKMARLMDIPQVADIGSITLGPVFAKAIKNDS